VLKLGEGIFGEEIIAGIIESEESENLITKELDEKEREKAYKVRYRIFAEKLGWLIPNPHEMDYDHYDEYARHVGVFLNGRMIGYSRIIFPDGVFMIEEDFKDLVNEELLEKKNSLEISRVLVDTSRPDYRLYTTMLLYRDVYLSAMKRNIRYGYIVVVKKFLDKIKLIFPFEQIGETVCFQEGVPTVAAIVDARKIEERFREESDQLYKWFAQKE